MTSLSRDARLSEMVRTVLEYHAYAGRHDLPWRNTQDPYAIWLSEVMLQQTQAERGARYYKVFLDTYPTVQSLASASQADTLKLWSGLGYNRRAVNMHTCAQTITRLGSFPNTYAELVELPGVGPYTAAAILAFAYNIPHPCIETNIRTVFLHHLFPRSSNVTDVEILKWVVKSLALVPSVRTWYAALMDYGVYLKKMHPNPSRRSKTHVRQSVFKGSLREVRGAILKKLVNESKRRMLLEQELQFDSERFKKAYSALLKEGMIVETEGLVQLA
jgi:A/G-specific adenine glycosylase